MLLLGTNCIAMAEEVGLLGKESVLFSQAEIPTAYVWQNFHILRTSFFFVPTTKKLLNILVLKWFCSEPWTRENDFFKIYWSIVDIQCVNLCYTAMWLRYTYIFLFFSIMNIVGFPDGSAVKNLPAMQEMWVQSLDGKIPWRRAQQPSSVFSPEKSHRQRSLAGCGPVSKKLDTTEMTEYICTHTEYTSLCYTVGPIVYPFYI